MQLQAAHAAALDQTPRLAHAFGAPVRVDAGECDRHVRMCGGEVGHRVVRELSAARQTLIHREHHERDAPRAVILRNGVRVALGAALAEVLARGEIGSRPVHRCLEVDMYVECDKLLRLDGGRAHTSTLRRGMWTCSPGPGAPYS